MIIKNLRIKGFKGFENEYYIDFNENTTVIEGENFQGKTSIGEAICWCFLGCNLFGNDKTVNIINKNSSTAYCELEFSDNDEITHRLIRCKGKENIVILDGKKATVETLSKFYGEKKMFLSIYNPYYFSSLEPKEQRELLRGILPAIDYKEAFELLSSTDKEILKEPRIDINSFIKGARENIKSLEKEQDSLEGKIQYAMTIAATVVGEEKRFEKDYVLQCLERDYEDTLKSISGDTKKEMKFKIEDIDKKMEKCNEELSKLRNEYKETKKNIQSIKDNNTVCPVCNGKILDDEKSKEILENQAILLEKITNTGKEIEEEIKALNTQKAMLDIKCNSLNPNEKKEEILKKLQEKIVALKLEKEDIQKNNYEVKNKISNVEKANSDIIIFNKALEEIKNEKELLKSQVLVATSLNNLIIKKQMDMVSQYLDRVYIVFSKVDYTTGEIKDDYKIFYDEKEINVLSLSEKIRASLEISNLINKIVGLNIPTFIDNSESITHYNNKFDNQIILSKVIPNKELSVNDELELVV